MILRCRRILGSADAALLDGWVRLDGDRIAEVGAGAPPPGSTVVEVDGWLTPGLVDIHVHGGGGASFQSGDVAEVATAVDFHRRHGTTTLLASLVSDRLDDLAVATARLTAAVEADLVAGVHLEGPFLATARCGAHDPALLREPDPADLQRLLASGPVRMVTIAPELHGGLDAVRRVVAHGAVAAVGHTDATYAETVAAVEAGARVATHLFNGMRPLHHREPGPVLALLDDPRVVVELINDGVHLHPALVDRLLGTLGERVALVTDAVAAAGLLDGNYRLGTQTVTVSDGVSVVGGSDALAGSTLTMADAVANAVRRGVAPATAVTAATATPARTVGLDAEVGRIATGLRADVVAFDETFGLERVWRAGQLVP